MLAQGTPADFERAKTLPARWNRLLPASQVEPTWFENNTKFWYTIDRGAGKKESIVVDAVKGTRTVVKEADLPKADAPDRPNRTAPPRRRGSTQNRSPDGKWELVIRDANVWLREVATQTETGLSTDGKASDSYNGPFFWSPDSKKVIVNRTRKGGDRVVTLVESSPKDQLQPRNKPVPYLKPGDEIPQPKPHLFDIATKHEIAVKDTLFNNPWDVSFEHWADDSSQFTFVYNQRGHQVVRLVAIDATTGAARAIVNEECPTFFDYANKLDLRYLPNSDDAIWMSERSGYNHLYLIDTKTGTVKNPITKGDWVVRRIDRVDAATKQVWLRTMGENPKHDPYHVQYARVNFDGSNFTRLTTTDAMHDVRWSPDQAYFLDRYSTLTDAPTTELCKADGTKILTIEAGSTDVLKAAGWAPPEMFVTPGRDGKTPIWGYAVRPSNFDPKKRYPIIEHIYAGPHDHHVRHAFQAVRYEQAIAELGFIVVKIDGMGTNWRSKAFHDVAWKNLADSGFPDRIKWIEAYAAKHPEADLSRGVGIFGGSAGGQSSLGGMLAYPKFYTVGVSDCGCHDNRIDKIWWNELWMSWPIGPHYAAQSNVTNAHKLEGKLLLVVGEMDTNVDPASTLQVVNQLIKADKDFDFLMVPGGGHGIAESPYGKRRRGEFFVRHLLKIEPRNE